MSEYCPNVSPVEGHQCDLCHAPWFDVPRWHRLRDWAAYRLWMLLPSWLAMSERFGFKLLPYAGGHAFGCGHAQPFVEDTTP